MFCLFRCDSIRLTVIDAVQSNSLLKPHGCVTMRENRQIRASHSRAQRRALSAFLANIANCDGKTRPWNHNKNNNIQIKKKNTVQHIFVPKFTFYVSEIFEPSYLVCERHQKNRCSDKVMLLLLLKNYQQLYEFIAHSICTISTFSLLHAYVVVRTIQNWRKLFAFGRATIQSLLFLILSLFCFPFLNAFESIARKNVQKERDLARQSYAYWVACNNVYI